MAARVPLTNFIALGQRLCILLNPGATHVNTLIQEITGFMQLLRDCRFERTLIAAQPLTNITSVPYAIRSGAVTEVAEAQLKAYMQPILSTLYSEAGQQELAAINTGAVSGELRDLRNRVALTAIQERLLDETLFCIEAGAYRAGAIMVWNLAYDFIRQWVFDNHLAAFNQSLTTAYLDRNGNALFEPIRSYDDFFAGRPGERTVIDTCFRAQMIGERLRDNLRHYLRRRNDYAHPTFTSPSAEQTNAYVKDLIDIITAPPFRP